MIVAVIELDSMMGLTLIRKTHRLASVPQDPMSWCGANLLLPNF